MPPRPEDLGMSSDRLARIDRHLRDHYVGPGKIAGCQALVARRGEIVHQTVLGSREDRTR